MSDLGGEGGEGFLLALVFGCEVCKASFEGFGVFLVGGEFCPEREAGAEEHAQKTAPKEAEFVCTQSSADKHQKDPIK